MTATEETPVWSGTPSQWVNFGTFALCWVLAIACIAGAVLWSRPILAAGTAIPAFGAFWAWLTTRCTRIDVTSERISTRVGVFSRRRSDMELYRIKDTSLHEPFLLRLVSLGNIHLESSDRTTPTTIIPAIRDAEALRQQIRGHVERMRIARHVREMDFET